MPFFPSETFWKNPQFQLVLREKDQPEEEDEDEDENDEDDEEEVELTPEEKKRAEKQKQKAKKCTVLVELLQKNRRQKDKVNFLYVAFHIYKVRMKLYLFSFWISAPSFLFFWNNANVSLCLFCFAGSS